MTILFDDTKHLNGSFDSPSAGGGSIVSGGNGGIERDEDYFVAPEDPLFSSDHESHGDRLRREVNERRITSFIGIYDAFSASIAARHHNALFVSGFGFAASYYGLPDIGFIAWTDMVAFVQRLRSFLPTHMLLVDIDDGYADTEVACHTVQLMEAAGASGVILEDQARPRACGHTDGKHIMDIEPFMEKLKAVLAVRKSLFVVARTDVTDPDEALSRVRRFAAAGADAVLVDGLKDLKMLSRIKKAAGGLPVVFNQLAGGKSPNCSLAELADLGVSMVNYSTPCLFSAQVAMDKTICQIKEDQGSLEGLAKGGKSANLESCKAMLDENLVWRKGIRK
jgi:2-methylisocitrate lyase-like PEP mutase family enzyme